MSEPSQNASTRFALSDPQRVMAALIDDFAEHARIERGEGTAVFTLPYGRAELRWDDAAASFRVGSNDDSGLAFIKYALVEHVLNLLDKDEAQPRIVWQGDGAVGGQPLPYFRELTVVSVANVTPHMRRVRLKGHYLARFAQGGLHIRLLFPPKGIAKPQWPVTGEDGRPVWPEGEAKLSSRVYTIRAIDVAAGTMDIDMVVHGEESDAPGSGFALTARPGDPVGMTGPGGGTAGRAKWYLLAGDETALPAISRILEELPEGVKAVVRVEVPDAGEEQALESRADLDLQWLHRNDAEAGTTTLLEDAVRAVEFPHGEDDVFVWAGCEFAAFRSIRALMRKERGLPRERQLIVAYWRRGQEGDEARKSTDA